MMSAEVADTQPGTEHGSVVPNNSVVSLKSDNLNNSESQDTNSNERSESVPGANDAPSNDSGGKLWKLRRRLECLMLHLV